MSDLYLRKYFPADKNRIWDLVQDLQEREQKYYFSFNRGSITPFVQSNFSILEMCLKYNMWLILYSENIRIRIDNTLKSGNQFSFNGITEIRKLPYMSGPHDFSKKFNFEIEFDSTILQLEHWSAIWV